MKALQIDDYNRTPALVDLEEPAVAEGQVLIKVAGAALNPLDLKIMAGYMQDFFPVHFPYTLGTDVSGTIVQTGAGAGSWAVGDKVAARLDPSAGGGVAEYAVVPVEQLVAAPSSVPLPTVAGAVTAAATAWQALTEVARVQAGQRVLVHAAAGGVGSFAVQLAARLGAHVIATASTSGLKIADALGAHEVIDYTAAPFGSAVSDVDVVIDTVGGDVEEQSLKVLRPGGTLVAVPMPPDAERAASLGLRAEFVFHASDAARLATVLGFLDDGVSVLLDRQAELSGAAEALSYLAEGHARGKVVVAPWS